MMFERDVHAYLNGDKFSSGYAMRFVGENPAEDRLQRILNIVRGKRVIHVGCADHKPLIKDKIAADTWLHARLERECSAIIGIDIDADAIEYLRRLGIRDVHCHDIMKDDVLGAVRDGEWDYMVLGEIVEHLDDPVAFLRALQGSYAPFVSRAVITAPNACRYTNFRCALSMKEFINTDHRFWFTPFTLAKVIHCAGMTAREFFFVNASDPKNRLKRALLNRFPQFKDTLVVTADFPS